MTPIHDHSASDCWVAGIEGSCEEVIFSLQKDGKPCLLNQREVAAIGPEAVGHIADHKGVHLIRNNSDNRCATLHLYAPSIEQCYYYESLDCQEKVRSLSFHSIGGVLQ